MAALIVAVHLGTLARALASDDRVVPSLVFIKLHKCASTSVAYAAYIALAQSSQRLGMPLYTFSRADFSLASRANTSAPAGFVRRDISAACARVGCAHGTACLLHQHAVSRLFVLGRPSPQLAACFGGTPNVITTVLREPMAHTLSAYFYFRCGNATTAAGVAADLIRHRRARSCSHLWEYENVFGSPKGGVAFGRMHVGVTEELDDYYILLAERLRVGLGPFARALPVLRKAPPPGLTRASFAQLQRVCLRDGALREFLFRRARNSFLLYALALRRFRRWRAEHPVGWLDTQRAELRVERARHLAKLGLRGGDGAGGQQGPPFDCPLSAETQARLPPLDGEGSRLQLSKAATIAKRKGRRGANKELAYCV